MLISNLSTFQNAARCTSQLQLSKFLFRNTAEARFLFLDQFRTFRNNCWICRRLLPTGSVLNEHVGGGGRKLGYRVKGLNLPQKFNLVRTASYCTVRASENTNKNKRETENIFTIPNALCMVRIGMTPFIASMVINSHYPTAIGLLTVAGITDLLDGWIARVYPGQSSVMGSFLDPLADKILVGTLFLSLTYNSLIPLALTTLIVGRDLLLIAFGFYIRFQSLDPPRTLGRYFNVALPTVQLAPTFISKVNTGLQLAVIGATLASTVITSVDLHPYLELLWYTTGATTIGSAVYYCFAKDTVKLLRQTSIKMKNRVKNK